MSMRLEGLSRFTVLSRLAAVCGRMVKAMENRRAAKALMHLDARGLRDIGLTRDAVYGAFASTTFLEDPTIQLSRIAARRGKAPSGRENAPVPQGSDRRQWPEPLPSLGPLPQA